MSMYMCMTFINVYIFWRGAWLVFWELLTLLGNGYDKWTGQDLSKQPIKITFKMYSVKAVLKYFFRLLRMKMKSSDKAPAIVVEGTYTPKSSFHCAGIKIKGPLCDNDRCLVNRVVEKYPSLHRKPYHAPWLKVIAFKAHFAYEALFHQLYELCREQGGFFVGTVTNDPFAETHLTCLGYDDETMIHILDYVKSVPNLHHVAY